MKMNRPDIINQIHISTGATKQFSDSALDIVIEGLTDALADGNDVKISKFGTFYVKKRKECMARHPITGEPVKCGERISVGFKPSVELRRRVGDIID